MKTKILIIILATCNSVISQIYIISRRAALEDIKHSPDIVQIPPSRCGNSTGEDECLHLGGSKVGSCRCECDKKEFNDRGDSNNFVYNSSTFGFINNKWKCQDNEDVRNHTDCLLSLGIHPHQNEPIATIPLNQSVQYRIYDFEKGGTLDISDCAVNAANSFLVKCRGQLEPMNHTVIIKRFRVKLDKLDVANLVVDRSESSDYPLPRGNMIKLGINCPAVDHDRAQRCLVLKVEGHIECPLESSSLSPPLSSSFVLATSSASSKLSSTFTPPPSSSLSVMTSTIIVSSSSVSSFLSTFSSSTISLPPSSPSSPSSSTSTLSPSPSLSSLSSTSPSATTSVLCTYSSCSPASSPISSTLSSLSSTFPFPDPTPSKASTQMFSSSIVSSVQTTADVPTNVSGSGSKNTGDNLSWIGFMLAGVLLFIIIVLVVVLVVIKRRKDQRRRRSQSTAFIVENNSYEQVTDIPPFQLKPDSQSSNPDYYNTVPDPEARKNRETFKGAHPTSVSNRAYETMEHLPNNVDPTTSSSSVRIFPDAKIIDMQEAKRYENVPSNNNVPPVMNTTREHNRNTESLYHASGAIIDDTEEAFQNDEALYHAPGSIISDDSEGGKFQRGHDDGNIYNTLNEPQTNEGSPYRNLENRDAPNVYESLSRINKNIPVQDDEALYEKIV